MSITRVVRPVTGALMLGLMASLGSPALAQERTGPLPLTAAPSRGEPTGPLTLAVALGLVLERNPALRSFDWDIRAAEARRLQAGLAPNPEVSATTEDFGGRGDLRGFRSAESTIQLDQLIELGGKRAKRVAFAGLERELAVQDYEAKRLDLLAATSQAYVELLAAQDRLAFAEETFRIGGQTMTVIQERIRAGRAAPLEENRARVAQSSLRLEAERARSAVEAGRKRLASFWGSPSPMFSRAEGNLEETIAAVPPSLEDLRLRTAANPDLTRWNVEIQLRESDVAVEQSKAVPDLTVSAGIKRFQQSDDNAFLVGIAIPIPVRNRNQGSIQEAGTRLNKAYAERQATQTRVDAELAAAHNELTVARNELAVLRSDIIPGARTNFDAVQQSYQLGRAGYLEVLDAQRVLLEAQAQQIEVLAAYQRAQIEIQRLTGQAGPAVARQ
jgi:cobalt-zinc-cadmium efflux system outer membrane protein